MVSSGQPLRLSHRSSICAPPPLTHVAEIAADSLYEAAVLALAEFEGCGFTDARTGPATRLDIAVLAPSTLH
jgi:hypothetical protein